ncbi:hypothetical protein AMECASPLE_006980 [Ameca splendens]|uniref:Uncharacterized protein n=1 Tax=Ameca splendens TaxID=208324 RepID=A0ABV1A5U4_9TELE
MFRQTSSSPGQLLSKMLTRGEFQSPPTHLDKRYSYHQVTFPSNPTPRNWLPDSSAHSESIPSSAPLPSALNYPLTTVYIPHSMFLKLFQSKAALCVLFELSGLIRRSLLKSPEP